MIAKTSPRITLSVIKCMCKWSTPGHQQTDKNNTESGFLLKLSKYTTVMAGKLVRGSIYKGSVDFPVWAAVLRNIRKYWSPPPFFSLRAVIGTWISHFWSKLTYLKISFTGLQVGILGNNSAIIDSVPFTHQRHLTIGFCIPLPESSLQP